jgi:hypothetical protein
VYFNGQISNTNFDYTRLNQYKVLGKDNGYQHLIIDTEAKNLPSTTSLTWMNGNGFYTVSTLATPGMEFFITRLGANDPNYNLRKQMGILFRFPESKNKKLLTVYEMHGFYNPVTEAVSQSEGSVKSLRIIEGNDEQVCIQITLKSEKTIDLLYDLKFANSNHNEMEVNGELMNWEGNYKLIIN